MLDIRILTVKQPWAWALVRGLKNVENRSKPIPLTVKLPQWILISASKNTTKAEFEREAKSLVNHLVLDGYDLYVNSSSIDHLTDYQNYQRGGIIGAVRLAGRGNPNVQNGLWHNIGDEAWIVDDSRLFSNMIAPEGFKGKQTLLTWLSTQPTNVYHQVIQSLQQELDPDLFHSMMQNR